MSFSVSLSGHSNGPHNEGVKEAVEEAVAKLNTLPGVTGSVSGYSNDNDGRVEFSYTLTGPEQAPTTEETTSG